jgi:hypothetical protein
MMLRSRVCSSCVLAMAAISACRHVFAEVGDIVFGRHVFDDVSEHVADFFESGFLRRHMEGSIPHGPEGR